MFAWLIPTNHNIRIVQAFACAVLACVVGCNLTTKKGCSNAAIADMKLLELESDGLCMTQCNDSVATPFSERPNSTQNPATAEAWELELSEAIRYALEHSQVIRDLGGRALRSPGSVATNDALAIQESDPRFGVEAALSAFDTAFSTRLYAENNDRALNNILLGGGTRTFKQDLAQYTSELRKRTAMGTLLSARHKRRV